MRTQTGAFRCLLFAGFALDRNAGQGVLFQFITLVFIVNGSHRRYLFTVFTSTFFRFYIGAVANIATTGDHANRLYLEIQNANGTMAPGNEILNNSTAQVREIHISVRHRQLILPTDICRADAQWHIQRNNIAV